MLKANFGMSECDSAPQNDSENTDKLKYRGSHSMIDITKCYIKEKDTEATCLALFICRQSVVRTQPERF